MTQLPADGFTADTVTPPALATLEQLKARLNTSDGNTEDTVLAELLEAACERIAGLAGREFTPNPATDAHTPITRRVILHGGTWCPAGDVRKVRTITADGTDVTADTRVVVVRRGWPAHAIVLPAPATTVEITGWFGFRAVPPSIRDAALGWAQRAYHELRARMSDSTVDPDGVVTSYYRQVPAFVSAAVDEYRIAGT